MYFSNTFIKPFFFFTKNVDRFMLWKCVITVSSSPLHSNWTFQSSQAVDICLSDICLLTRESTNSSFSHLLALTLFQT